MSEAATATAAAPPPAASASLNATTAPPASAATPPATGTPGATSAAPGAPPAVSGGDADWTKTLDEDSRGYVQNKGFKTPGDVLTSYRQLEKTFGVPQDRLLKLPENMDTPEGRAVWERLGAPKTAAEYQLDKLVPKEGKGPEFAKWAGDLFHEIGIPARAAEKIITKWNERMLAGQKATKDNFEAQVVQGEATLKRDWGAAYDTNINLAKQGMKALELSPEEVDRLDAMMGRERLFKKLRSIGAGVGEAGFVGGKPAANDVLAPEQARQKLNQIKTDPLFTKRYLAGEADARNEMEKLQRMAYPGEMTI